MHAVLLELAFPSWLRILRRAGAVGVAALLTLAVAAPGLCAQESGPRDILITYRCQPADRPAFRAYLEHEEIPVLEQLKRDGTLKRYNVLFNPVVTETFDAMIVMDFESYAATGRWLEIERRMPGGLNAAGLKLAKPLQTYFADLQWEGASGQPGSGNAVFYVIPYSYSSLDQYKAYIDAYLIPQVRGWMKEGVLNRYSLYLNRYPVGDPWDSLFIYEYRDRESFGRREETIAKVRSGLKNDPVWKRWSDIKATLRSESENTIMEEVTPRASGASHAAPKGAR
jgi:hypothetical protein